MTRSAIMRWVWFVLCAVLAVVAGCATPVQVTWSTQAGDWQRSGTLELRLDRVASGGLRVMGDEPRDAWPTPSEWAYREVRGLPLPTVEDPAPAPRASAPDLRRLRARVGRAPTVRLVRGKVVAAPTPPPATPDSSTPTPTPAPAPAPAPAVTVAETEPSPPAGPAPAPGPAPVSAPAAQGPRASRREELAMLAAIVVLALGTIAVPFMVSRRRAR